MTPLEERLSRMISRKVASTIRTAVAAMRNEDVDRATIIIIDACGDRVVGEVTASVVARSLAEQIRCPCDAEHQYRVESIDSGYTSTAERDADGVLASMVSAHLNHAHEAAVTVAEGCTDIELKMAVALGCALLARPGTPIITANEEHP